MEIEDNVSLASDASSRYVSLPTINIFPTEASHYRTDSLHLARRSSFSESIWKDNVE